jgi:hypothetical protein
MKMEMKMEMTINNIDIQVFAERFPSPQEVLNVFSPSNWGLFLREQERCLTAPNVTLAMLSDYYDYSTTSALVENQYKGLYKMTSLQDYPEKRVSMAAELFTAAYDHQLTPYSLVLFFAKYQDFKDSFREFDPQDIHKVCGKKFIPWWNEKKAQQEQNQQQNKNETSGCGGLEEAIVRWMLKGTTDEEIRRGGLYGMQSILGARIAGISEEMIKAARIEYYKRMAGEVF